VSRGKLPFLLHRRKPAQKVGSRLPTLDSLAKRHRASDRAGYPIWGLIFHLGSRTRHLAAMIKDSAAQIVPSGQCIGQRGQIHASQYDFPGGEG
jgi:hypothetical protein